MDWLVQLLEVRSCLLDLGNLFVTQRAHAFGDSKAIADEPQDFLDSIARSEWRPPGEDEHNQAAQVQRSGESTPTADESLRQVESRDHSSQPTKHDVRSMRPDTVLDASVDVIIASQKDTMTSSNGVSSSSNPMTPVQATMIISVWIMDGDLFYTLTFTSSQPSQATVRPARPSKRFVTRSATSVAQPLGSAGSSSSGHRSFLGSVSNGSDSSLSSPLLQTPSFPPRGPPSSQVGSTVSLFQKASRLKDAILDNINLPPMYALWKDESFGIPNKALLALGPSPAEVAGGTPRDWLEHYKVWTEDFQRQLTMDEFPIIEICRSQKKVEGRRLGMYHPKTKSRLVFELTGEPIFDDNTGEFLGGVLLFKDITSYTKKIAEQIVENENQFEYICQKIPIMVWRTTEEGVHDWYNKVWYDYTGLTEEESFGEGWRLAFHEDDLVTAGATWAHSLATGEEYNTEYRCKRADGMWRWMLGRAVPMLDGNGKIVKWFGTCTDIHDSVMTRMAAKETREQLQRVMKHASVTLWAVSADLVITLFEGSMLQHSASPSANGKSTFVGSHIEDFVDRDVWKGPMERLLNGSSTEEFVESHLEARDMWFRTRMSPLYTIPRTAGIEGDPYIDGITLVSVDSLLWPLHVHFTELSHRLMQLSYVGVRRSSKHKRKRMLGFSPTRLRQRKPAR